MDYQGNNFPEERDERESKTYRTVKGIFKWTMYGISFLVYAIIFYLLFANRDSKILDRMYFTEEAREIAASESGEFEVYRINSADFMNYYGTLQLYSNYYAEDAKVLEIGLKYNAKELADGKTDSFYYTLTDSDGNEYECTNIVTDSHGRYGFARVCFSGVDLKLDLNDLRYKADADENKSGSRVNTIWYFKIKRIDDGSEVGSFAVYKNSTVFSKVDYEPAEGGK